MGGLFSSETPSGSEGIRVVNQGVRDQLIDWFSRRDVAGHEDTPEDFKTVDAKLWTLYENPGLRYLIWTNDTILKHLVSSAERSLASGRSDGTHLILVRIARESSFAGRKQILEKGGLRVLLRSAALVDQSFVAAFQLEPKAVDKLLKTIDFLRPIGRGAFSTVYRGMFGKEVVVVKQLAFLSDVDRRRLNSELVALWMFNGFPRLCGALGHFTRDGNVYVITDFAEYGSLTHCMSAVKLSPAQRLQLAVDFATGLELLHRFGVVHRDIKPANCLVFSGFRGALSDFGTLRQISLRNTTFTTLAGTMIYMAPEYLIGKQLHVAVRAQADIFSFGYVLWELWNGASVANRFDAYDLFSLKDVLAGRMASGEPPVEIDMSCPWRHVISRCWQYDPVDRPTAAGVLADLTALQSRTQSWSPKASRQIPSTSACAVESVAEQNVAPIDVLPMWQQPERWPTPVCETLKKYAAARPYLLENHPRSWVVFGPSGQLHLTREDEKFNENDIMATIEGQHPDQACLLVFRVGDEYTERPQNALVALQRHPQRGGFYVDGVHLGSPDQKFPGRTDPFRLLFDSGSEVTIVDYKYLGMMQDRAKKTFLQFQSSIRGWGDKDIPCFKRDVVISIGPITELLTVHFCSNVESRFGFAGVYGTDVIDRGLHLVDGQAQLAFFQR